MKKPVYRCLIYERLHEDEDFKEVVEIFDTDIEPYEQVSLIVRGFHLKKLFKSKRVMRLRSKVAKAELSLDIDVDTLLNVRRPIPSQKVTRLFSRAFEDHELFCEKVIFVGPYPVTHIADSCLSQ